MLKKPDWITADRGKQVRTIAVGLAIGIPLVAVAIHYLGPLQLFTVAAGLLFISFLLMVVP